MVPSHQKAIIKHYLSLKVGAIDIVVKYLIEMYPYGGYSPVITYRVLIGSGRDTQINITFILTLDSEAPWLHFLNSLL